MSKPRCYLVDDEELSLGALHRMLIASRRADVVGFATDPAQAIDEIERLEPDLLFLDIHMPEIDGFELLSRLPGQPFVIFTTAYDQHALRAFETNSVDYLLKPIDEHRLLRALEKLEGRWPDRPRRGGLHIDEALLRVAEILKPRNFLRRVGSQTARGVSLIEVERVTHFISEDRYTYACTDTGRFLIDFSLAVLEERLDPACFVRIHRSAIVNLSYVDQVSGWFAGRFHVRLRDKARTELPVSRSNVNKLRHTLGL
jgi:two-component system LytT family response regulator